MPTEPTNPTPTTTPATASPATPSPARVTSSAPPAAITVPISADSSTPIPAVPIGIDAGLGAEGGEPPCFAHLVDQIDPVAGPSEEALARLVRNLADAVVICDAAGAIVFWNDAATKLFGYDAGEAIGQSLDLIIPDRLRSRHWDGYRQVMHTGHTDYGDRLLEVPALHRDGNGNGRRLSIAFTVTLLTVPGQDQPVGVAAVIRDDTEQWQQRRKLQKELNELRAAGATHPADTPV